MKHKEAAMEVLACLSIGIIAIFTARIVPLGLSSHFNPKTPLVAEHQAYTSIIKCVKLRAVKSDGFALHIKDASNMLIQDSEFGDNEPGYAVEIGRSQHCGASQ